MHASAELHRRRFGRWDFIVSETGSGYNIVWVANIGQGLGRQRSVCHGCNAR